MSPRTILAVVFLAVLLPGSAAGDRGGYSIASFHTDLTVGKNADLLVEEHLEVDFSEPRHGIYRVIPVRYTDRLGYQYSLGLRLLGVHDGQGHPYGVKVTSQGRNVQIRIGDANHTVQGRAVYVIRYTVHDALGVFPDHDELYWNATGNEWSAPIGQASATVHLPSPLPADSLEAVGYAGAFGERSIEVSATASEPGTIHFESIQGLGPLEGLTVDAVWPRGYVTHPGAGVRVARFLGDNLPFLFPLFALAGLWLRYRRSGRDPRGPAAVVVRYEPPPGITPSELGTLMDERVDLRDITSAIVDLAVRGYLVIETAKKELLFGLGSRDDTVFRKAEKPWDGLTAHERLILKGIFENGDAVHASDLKEKFYRQLPAIQDALYGQLTTSGYFAGKPSAVRTRTGLLGVAAAAATTLIGLAWTALRGGVFPEAAAVSVVAGVLTLIVFLAFAPAMPRRTGEGVKVRSWGLGFQEFTERVEGKDLGAPDAKSAFETLLPYAMALGIASAWARKFEGIYAAGGPTWYLGGAPGVGFSTPSLERSLSASMTAAGHQLAASPRSSGSGGGGSSGGGGGGGGGGSW